MGSRNLLYRFPSSQSSSSTSDLRHSWPIYQHAQQSHLMSDDDRSEHSEPVGKPSARSNGSLNSSTHGPPPLTKENIHPNRATSPSPFSRLVHGKASNPVSCRSWSDQHIRHSHSATATTSPNAEPWIDVDLSAGCGEGSIQSRQNGLSFEVARRDLLSVRHRRAQPKPKLEVDELSMVTADAAKRPFWRWMNSVRHRSPGPSRPLKVREERWSLDDFDESKDPSTPQNKGKRHKKSSSWSSSGLLTVVKSATANPAWTHPKRTERPAPSRRSNRSSGLFEETKRASVDKSQSAYSKDEAAWDRARQRRRTLEEILSSEESYVADLKVLVYVTLLESASNVSQQNWTRVHQNITEILTLHDELLTGLRQVMRDSEGCFDKIDSKQGLRFKHTRWRSQDGSQATTAETAIPVARRSAEVSWFGRKKKSALVAESHEAAEIARVFDRMMTRFFVYEEYGAKYESMLRDMATTSKQIPNWHAYERGIEALAHSLTSSSPRGGTNRKGLTFEDLLIKPIQRVCKYPLLFADLYKYTPIIDGAESRAEIEKVLCRLRETTQEINKATNDQETRVRIQRSWQLQDLIDVPDVVTAPPSLRRLGHAILCGVLYVTYQSLQGLRGGFMLCVLFKSYVLIAAPGAGSTRYECGAIINLGGVRIEEPNNGRGLQCHTALYSWKATFENEHNLYEMILCACSSHEEEQWRSRLLEYSTKEGQRQAEDDVGLPPRYALLNLKMKSLGQAFRQSENSVRPLSLQRASTIPRGASCQVIIKNTNAIKDHQSRNISPSDSMGRSQSLMANNRVPILAPKRTERTRMEHGLAGVWTRELLPYPGMGGQRGENMIRNSASSMLQRLRGASLSSTFSKRSTSVSSLADSRSEHLQESVSQIDDQSAKKRPKLHESKSLDVGLGMKKGTIAGSQVAHASRRSNSLTGTRLFRIKRANKDITAPDVMNPVEDFLPSESSSVETIKIEATATTGLFTGLSTEGIRGWFHSTR